MTYSVGHWQGYGLGEPWVRILEWEFSLLQKSPNPPWDPSSLLLNVYGGSFQAVKRPQRETDHHPVGASRVFLWFQNCYKNHVKISELTST
jgi:hypothetical protein